MAIGYLLGGLFGILYFFLVGFMGGIKRTPWVLKATKMKLGKTMSDDKAAKIDLIFGGVLGAAGVFLLIFGAVQGG